MLDTGLDGKVTLITGANSPYGIGAAAARAFAAQGAAVFITYLRQQIDLSPQAEAEPDAAALPGEAFYRAAQQLTAETVVRQIRAAGGRVERLEADLADPATVPLLFDRAEQAFGPIDVLVNNAAYCVPDTFLPPGKLSSDERAAGGAALQPITAESHDRHFAVNSRAVALTMAEFARRHVARGASWGRIINISTDGAPGFASEVSYGASKYALNRTAGPQQKSWASSGSPSTSCRLVRYRLAGSRRSWSAASRNIHRSGAPASPRMWPTPCCCWPPSRRAGSPGR